MENSRVGNVVLEVPKEHLLRSGYKCVTPKTMVWAKPSEIRTRMESFIHQMCMSPSLVCQTLLEAQGHNCEQTGKVPSLMKYVWIEEADSKS